MHDKSVFEHPDVFDPERFIKDPDSAKVTDLIFGTGRVSPILLLAYSCEAVMYRDVLACMSWDTSCEEHCRTFHSNRVGESALELICNVLEAINAMNLVWGFDLKKPLDEHGNIVELDISDYVHVCVPLPSIRTALLLISHCCSA